MSAMELETVAPARTRHARRGLRRPRVRRGGPPLPARTARPSTPWSSPTPTSPRSARGFGFDAVTVRGAARPRRRAGVARRRPAAPDAGRREGGRPASRRGGSRRRSAATDHRLTRMSAGGPRDVPVAADRRRSGAAGGRDRRGGHAAPGADSSCARPAGSTDEQAERVAAALGQVELRRHADGQARRRRGPDVLHPRRARAGHPRRRRAATGPRASRVGGAERRRPDLRHRRRPGRLRPGRPDHGRDRPRPAPGRDGAGQPRRARARRRGQRRATRPRSTSRPSARRTPTPPGAAHAAELPRRRLDAAVDVRRVAAHRPRLRQGRAGHPALAGAGRRRGGVGQRPGRGQGGRALVAARWPPPTAGRP